MIDEQRQERPLRGRRALELKTRWYQRRSLIPNAVTLGNMFCGFLTVIYGASGRFDKAAVAIALAILLDGLDGRVARRLNATSKFGLEVDSFADLVSFGIAPALLMYFWCFRATADEFGVFITFVYALCAATRLARFNISAENLKSFTGLPTPGAAGMVASLVNLSPALQAGRGTVTGFSALMLALAFLMVSRIEFFSIKRLKVRGIHPFTSIVIGGLIALIWYNSKVGFLVLTASYVLSGPLGAVLRSRKGGKRGEEGEGDRLVATEPESPRNVGIQP